VSQDTNSLGDSRLLSIEIQVTLLLDFFSGIEMDSENDVLLEAGLEALEGLPYRLIGANNNQMAEVEHLLAQAGMLIQQLTENIKERIDDADIMSEVPIVDGPEHAKLEAAVSHLLGDITRVLDGQRAPKGEGGAARVRLLDWSNLDAFWPVAQWSTDIQSSI